LYTEAFMYSTNAFSLVGKSALVAGASRGIGLAIARHVAAAGARTIMASRSMQTLEMHAQELRGQGLTAIPMELDFTDFKSVDNLAAQAGSVDILINVAGTNIRKRFEQYSEDEIEKIMRTNLDGIVRLTQKVGAGMVERGRGGKIIHIGSLTSLLGIPYLTIYAMTKSALAGLTRVLAAEWGRHNIQVNCIAPGFILTDLNRDMWQPEAMKQWLKGAQSNPRLGTPEDIAPLAVFLSSSGSDYVTGQVIAVDGGYSTTAVWPFEP
jgi:gluconate 5-dehydrogenase